MDANVSSVFKAEVFRPLVVLLIPGALAVFPLVLLANGEFADVASFRIANPLIYYFGLFCVAISTGMIIENLGSMIEVLGWDKRLKRLDPKNFDSDWDLYLQTKYEIEPVGQHYLRTILLRMKFVTHLAIAVLVAVIGSTISHYLREIPSSGHLGLLACAGVPLSLYMFWESFQSCKVLARIRKLLVAGGSVAKTNGAVAPQRNAQQPQRAPRTSHAAQAHQARTRVGR